jgi:hypothetical protein
VLVIGPDGTQQLTWLWFFSLKKFTKREVINASPQNSNFIPKKKFNLLGYLSSISTLFGLMVDSEQIGVFPTANTCHLR